MSIFQDWGVEPIINVSGSVTRLGGAPMPRAVLDAFCAAAQDAVPLLVFDEIDANVGGEIAHAVGARMRELAKRHQVLCITHLPPVAAAATSQFVVTKEVRGGRTFTQLREVSGKARREELARMLGGKSDEALKLAATMLDQH